MQRLSAKSSTTLLALIIGVAAVVTFWPLTRHAFIRYDDVEYIIENPHVLGGLNWENLKWAFGSAYAANWHPVTWISHMLDVQLFGTDSGLHHLVSLLLHAANAIILFILLKRLTGSELRSATVALLFALHPLHVESVAWAAERKDVLSTFFGLLSLLCYASFVARRRAPSHVAPSSPSRISATTLYFGAIIFFALALMSKPMIVTLPFLLLLVDYWPLERFRPTVSFWKTLWSCSLEKLPFFVLTVGACVITILSQQGSQAIAQGFPLKFRLMNAAASYLKYIGKTFWPSKLSIIYPHPALTGDPIVTAAIAGLVLIVIVTGSSVFFARKAPWFLVGWCWFLGTLVPVSGLLQAGNQAMADRYTYLPLVGLFICVIWAAAATLARLRISPVFNMALGSTVILACAVVARHQLGYWKTNFSLFSHALDVEPRNALAHVNVGADFGERGEFVEAEKHFKEAIAADARYADAYYYLGVTDELRGRFEEARANLEQGLRLRPGHDLTMTHLGTVLTKLGQKEAGLKYLRESARLNPGSYFAHAELGNALEAEGDLVGAIEEYRVATTLKPGDPKLLVRLAEAQHKGGRTTEAIATFAELVRRFPANWRYHFNLGGALWAQGEKEHALLEYRQAVSLDPTNSTARYNLGIALAQLGRHAEASVQFLETVRLKPDSHQALAELGRAQGAQGHFVDARNAFQQAVQLCPTNANLYLNLGNAQLLTGQTNEAMEAFARAVKLQPDLGTRFKAEGETLIERGQWSAGITRLKFARWLCPAAERKRIESRIAWLLSTAPDTSARNGKEALALAKSALEGNSDPDATSLAALEVAFAEVGDFDAAIAMADRTRGAAVRESAADQVLAAENRTKLYRKQQAFREAGAQAGPRK